MKLRQLAFGRTVLGLLAGAFLVCGFSGCGEGGSAATLSGTVKYAGEPVAEGNIRLLAVEGTPGAGASAKIIDGKYSLSGEDLKSGKHQVVIFGYRGTGQMIEDEGAEPDSVGEDDAGEGDAAEGGPVEEREQYIPDKYNRDATEMLDLTAGENTKNYDLQP